MKLFALAGALALGVIATTAAAAPNASHGGSWCRDARVGGTDSVTICNTNSYAQCMAARQTQSETCFMSPAHARRW